MTPQILLQEQKFSVGSRVISRNYGVGEIDGHTGVIVHISQTYYEVELDTPVKKYNGEYWTHLLFVKDEVELI